MRRVLGLAALLLLPAARPGSAEEPKPAGPVPVPYPNVATGKRMHKPWVFSASARKVPLADGRVFVVNAETGEVVFGDGLHGARPETGEVPVNGSYRVGNGAGGNVEVRNGHVVTVPKQTPVPPRAVSKAK